MWTWEVLPACLQIKAVAHQETGVKPSLLYEANQKESFVAHPGLSATRQPSLAS